MGIESLRGIDPLLSDLNDSALLVRASIDVVTEALCRAKQAVDWRTDVYEHEVSISGSSLLAFQFRGQSWTFIHELNFLYLEFLEDAQLLSRLLSTDAVSYAISDTTNFFSYEFFSKGVSVERLEKDETGRLIFESKLRQITDNNKFSLSSRKGVDNFLQQQDIYIPALIWPEVLRERTLTIMIQGYLSNSSEFADSADDPVDPITFKSGDFERVDYLRIRSVER